jgi:glycosyl transferase family 10 (putative fucosyltransferase)
MITVGIVKDWDWPDLLRQTPGGKGVWNGVRFSLKPEPTCDFLVVLNNKMKTESKARCPRENVWCLMQEPYMKGHTDWMLERLEHFSRVLTHHLPSGRSKFAVSQPAIPWHVNKTFDQLISLEIPPKPKTLSWVVGNARDLPGHRKRWAFLKYIQQDGSLDIDLFGRAVQFIEDKWDGLAPYKYSLAIENSSSPDYWTEKIADCFLSWSVPIYYGCTNLEDYFPSRSFIRIPIDPPREGFESVKTILEQDNWEKRIPALKEARDRVLNRYQLFPHLSRIIHKQPQRNLTPTEVRLPPYKRTASAALNHQLYKIKKLLAFI